MLQLIVVTALLVMTVKCDYNPGGGSNYLPARRGHGSDTHNGFGLMEQGIGYGRDSGYGRTHSDGYGYGANNGHHDSYEGNSQVSRSLLHTENRNTVKAYKLVK